MKKNILFLTLFSLITTIPTTHAISRKTWMISGSILAAAGGCGAWFTHFKEQQTIKMLSVLEKGIERLRELKDEAEERELTEKELKQKNKIIKTLKKILDCKKLSKRNINKGKKELKEKQELYKKLKWGTGIAGAAGLLAALFEYFKDDTPTPPPVDAPPAVDFEPLTLHSTHSSPHNMPQNMSVQHLELIQEFMENINS